jgi:hypothetical protein
MCISRRRDRHKDRDGRGVQCQRKRAVAMEIFSVLFVGERTLQNRQAPCSCRDRVTEVHVASFTTLRLFSTDCQPFVFVPFDLARQRVSFAPYGCLSIAQKSCSSHSSIRRNERQWLEAFVMQQSLDARRSVTPTSQKGNSRLVASRQDMSAFFTITTTLVPCSHRVSPRIEPVSTSTVATSPTRLS